MIKSDRNPARAVNIYDRLINSYEIMTNQDYWAYSLALNFVGRKEESKSIVDKLSVIDTSSSAYYWQYLIAKYDYDYKQALTYLEESNFKSNEVIISALNQSLSLAQRDYYESESE